jgi:hypothetical protein
MKKPIRTQYLIKSALLISLILSIASFGGCSLPISSAQLEEKENEASVEMIEVAGESFTLAWNDDSSTTVTFKVYSRPHGSTDWTSLATSIEAPTLTVTTSMLVFGNYDFAVSRIASDGVESPLHTSFDASAVPASGWYLSWTP